MLREFAKDSVVYGVAAVLTRAVSLLLVPLLTRVLAPTEYGAVDILTLVGSLVALTVALEISQALPRFFADANTEKERVGYASTAFWFTLAAYSVVCIAGFAAAHALATLILGRHDFEGLFRAALGMYVATGIFLLLQSQLRWERRAVQYAITSLLAAALSLATVALLLLRLHTGPAAVFVGQTVGNAAGAIVALFFARHSFARVFSARRCREMLAFSAPQVPSGLAVFIALYSDRLIVQRILSLSEVGKLAVGYRFASMVGLVTIGFQSALMPLVFAKYREQETPAHLARIFRVFCGLALLLCTVLGLFAREIVIVLTSPNYYAAASVIPLLAPAVLLASMYVFAPGLVLTKRTGSVALLNFGGAGLNVVLNLILVPVIGINGAATATLISSALTFSGYMVASQRYYPVPHQWRVLAAALIAAAVTGMVGYSLGPPNMTVVLIKVLLFTALAVMLLRLELVRRAELATAVALIGRWPESVFAKSGRRKQRAQT